MTLINMGSGGAKMSSTKRKREAAAVNDEVEPPRPSSLLQATPKTTKHRAALVTPSTVSPSSLSSQTSSSSESEEGEPGSKRKLVFGRLSSSSPSSETVIPRNVRTVYTLVKKQTGSIGGNGSFGAIYGELTVGSMQKMVDLMKQHTMLDSTSRFIDVGSGLGKPNLHVTQDPGVEFSYGIEMERVRWMLGMSNLKEVVDAAHRQQQQQQHELNQKDMIGHACYFAHGNILKAKSFDPFTHVYMFSIGFPPELFLGLAVIFNQSESPYLICYHSPKLIIDEYGFDVELITQTPTSMHGSSEGHMGYIYRRTNKKPRSNSNAVKCDPLFQKPWDLVRDTSVGEMRSFVNTQIREQYGCGRRTRSSGMVMTA